MLRKGTAEMEDFTLLPVIGYYCSLGNIGPNALYACVNTLSGHFIKFSNHVLKWPIQVDCDPLVPVHLCF